MDEKVANGAKTKEGNVGLEYGLYTALETWVGLKGGKACPRSGNSNSNCYCRTQLLYEGEYKREAVEDNRSLIKGRKPKRRVKPVVGRKRTIEEVMAVLRKIVELTERLCESPKSEVTFLKFVEDFFPVTRGTREHLYAMTGHEGLAIFCRSGLAWLTDGVVKAAGDCWIWRLGEFERFLQTWMQFKTEGAVKRKRQVDGKSGTNNTEFYYREVCYKRLYRNALFEGFVKCWRNGHDEEWGKIPAFRKVLKESKMPVIEEAGEKSLRTHHYTLLSMSLKTNKVVLLVADYLLYRDTGGIGMQLLGKSAYFDPEAKVFAKHYSDLYVGRVPATVQNRLLEIYNQNYKLDGSYREDGRYNIRVPPLRSDASMDKLKYVMSEGGWNGMAELFGLRNSELESGEPDLAKFRLEMLFAGVEKMLKRGSEERNPGEKVEYDMKDDFGFYCSCMNAEEREIELFHLSVGSKVLRLAHRLRLYWFVALLPLTKSGMWIRIMPEVPMNENGELEVSQMTEWSHKENRFGSNTERPSLKADGIWVFISPGSMLIIPASLYNSGHLRTCVNGNKRAVFLVSAQEQGKGCIPVNVHQNALKEKEYIGCDSGKDKPTNIVVKREKGGLQEEKNRWQTKGVEAFQELFLM